MTVNFSKGKTEISIALRGKGTVSAKEELAKHLDDDGARIIPVHIHADNSTVTLRVVDHYKHLGSIIAIDACLVVEARARAKAAMSAYAPLAAKIFGAAAIPVELRIQLAFSLIFSRLFIMYIPGQTSLVSHGL